MMNFEKGISMIEVGDHKSAHWSVCQVLSTRAHLIRSEIERGGPTAFLPTFTKISYPDGKLSRSKRQLMPGYLFVQTSGEQDFYDGYGNRIAVTIGRVRDEEFARLFIGSETGRWNDVAVPVVERRRTRRRRPRPGKRWRGQTGRVA